MFYFRVFVLWLSASNDTELVHLFRTVTSKESLGAWRYLIYLIRIFFFLWENDVDFSVHVIPAQMSLPLCFKLCYWKDTSTLSCLLCSQVHLKHTNKCWYLSHLTTCLVSAKPELSRSCCLARKKLGARGVHVYINEMFKWSRVIHIFVLWDVRWLYNALMKCWI